MKVPPPLRPALVFALASACVMAGVLLSYQRQLDADVRPPRTPLLGPTPCTLLLHVAPGESFTRIAARLVSQGSVRSAWPLRWAARRHGWDRTIVPGWYRFRAQETEWALLERMGRGGIEEVRLTFPEGWRLERILSLLADSTWVPFDSLVCAAQDASWLERMEVPGPDLEGYIFPETYNLPRAESPRAELAALLRPGNAFWRDSLAAPAAALGLNRRQLWTLASIIEAEAARSNERARISAVFWNRMRLGMRLESDPTVLFALGRPPGALLYSDVQVHSPYNTYLVPGLPPGPICSPGRASLRAALHPEPGCQDLFFVARGDGSHVFSRTLEEHERLRHAIKQDQAFAGKRSDQGG